MLRGLDFNTTINGLFANYLNCNQILGYNDSIADIANQMAKNCSIINYANQVQDYRMMKYLNIACIFAYFNFSSEGQGRGSTELPRRLTSLYFKRKDCMKMFDQLRYANLPINLAFRTRTNYRLDFDDLYGVIQPRVKANFITKKEKQHVVNAMFIMIQNGISLAAKTNTVSKPILNPFSKYKKPVEKKPVSDFKKKDENVLMNEAGTSSRGFIFAPQFEKYLVYGVHKSNNLQILTF